MKKKSERTEKISDRHSKNFEITYYTEINENSIYK